MTSTVCLKVDSASDSADNLEDSSILISGDAQPEDDLESSSTVIGKEEADKARFSDLRLADDEEGSDIRPAGSSAKRVGPADDLKLADSEDLSDELGLGDDLGLGEDLDFESDDALLLSDDDLKLSAGSNQEILDDSGGSDLAIGAGDSGIGLASPSDSGLSLEGESSSAALELPEDEDMISLDDDLGSASDDGAALQQDEEFLLSPSDEMLGDESSDSGSQVIALDDSGAFDSDADVAAVGSGEPMLVADEAEGLDAQLEPIDEAALVAGAGPSIAAIHATGGGLLGVEPDGPGFRRAVAGRHRHVDGRHRPEHVGLEQRDRSFQRLGEHDHRSPGNEVDQRRHVLVACAACGPARTTSFPGR